MRKCKCEFCTLHKRLKKVTEGRSIKDLRALANDLFEMWFYMSDDLNYKQAVLDGSWPSAVEQLERALENARKIKKEREEKDEL